MEKEVNHQETSDSRNFPSIPYGRQHITEEDINAVTEVLRSDYLTQGPLVAEFEKAFANYIGSEYAVAVSNGTAALHLSALSLGIEEGDKVITTPITFSASANCIRYCGGEVTFADINPRTYLLDIDGVKKLLESSPRGTYKGIIPVDFAGRAVDMEAFRALADEYDLWIIEDACHAPGGFYKDSSGTKQKCGNATFANLAIFSFHPVKHIAAGEGGMITTNDERLYKKLLKLRTHGITKNETEFRNSTSFANGHSNLKSDVTNYPGWYMEMNELGYNYRITDFQCALGLSQLKRIKENLRRRREIAKIYSHAFDRSKYILGHSGDVEGHAYHLYVTEVEDRLGLYNYLKDHHIYAQVHYIPCHLMPYYRDLGWSEGDMPNAESYYKRCLSLPMFPTLGKEQQDYVIDKVMDFYR